MISVNAPNLRRLLHAADAIPLGYVPLLGG
jgi:hypothetical protein